MQVIPVNKDSDQKKVKICMDVQERKVGGKRGAGEENVGYEGSEGEGDVGSPIGRREEEVAQMGYGSIQVRQL